MAKVDVNVPDIGDFKDVPVIEVLVKPGDTVKVDQSLVTLESDKATMDVPSPIAGAVADVVTKVGDKVSMGALIARIDTQDGRPCRRAAAEPRRNPPPPPPAPAPPPAAPSAPPAPAPAAAAGPAKPDFSGVFAGPAVRRLARELDIDLTRVKGTGEHGRITREDVKAALAGAAAPRRRGGGALPAIPDGRLRQVRADRDRAAVAYQAHFRAAPARVLGQRARTSPTPTKPTSPTSRPSARASTTTPRKTNQSLTGCRCCRS